MHGTARVSGNHEYKCGTPLWSIHNLAQTWKPQAKSPSSTVGFALTHVYVRVYTT